jgi:DNA polymerase-1
MRRVTPVGTSIPRGLIVTPEQMNVWEKRLLSEDVSLDFETHGKKFPGAKVLGVSLATKDHTGYLPLEDINSEIPRFNRPDAIRLLEQLAISKSHKISHNFQFELHCMYALGIEMQPPFACTMLMAYNHDVNRKSVKLTAVCEAYNIGAAPDFDEFAKNRSMLTFPVKEIMGYSIPHAKKALELYDILGRVLRSNGLWSSYQIDIDCVPSVVWIERAGVLINEGRLQNLSLGMMREEQRLEGEIKEIAGEEFNVRSSQQLGVILYRKFGLPVKKRAEKTGRASVDKESVESLRGLHPIADKLLEYRETQKLRSTFIDGLDEFVGEDNRVHTSLNMAQARSGRFSSSNPNLQNIPTFDKFGVRQLFIAPPGKTLVVADYSQIEMRLAAVVSGDQELLDIYEKDDDIHSRTCMALFGEVTPELRKNAKTINFAVGYGMMEGALGRKLGIPKAEAKKYLSKFWKTYSGLASWNNVQIMLAKIRGYTTTLGGKRRILPDINSSEFIKQSNAERAGLNHIIQGTAAEILKIAHAELYKEYKDDSDVRCVLSVHDELVLEVPEERAEEVAQRQKEIMENLGGKVKFPIPLKVEVGIGKTWADAK